MKIGLTIAAVLFFLGAYPAFIFYVSVEAVSARLSPRLTTLATTIAENPAICEKCQVPGQYIACWERPGGCLHNGHNCTCELPANPAGEASRVLQYPGHLPGVR